MNAESASAAATSQPSVRSVVTVPTAAAIQGTTGRANNGHTPREAMAQTHTPTYTHTGIAT